MILSGVLRRIGKQRRFLGHAVFEVIEIGQTRMADLSVSNSLKAQLRVGRNVTILIKLILGHAFLLGIRDDKHIVTVQQRPFFITALIFCIACIGFCGYGFIHLWALLAGVLLGILGGLILWVWLDICEFSA